MILNGERFSPTGRVEAMLAQNCVKFRLGKAVAQVRQKSATKVLAAVQVKLVDEAVKGGQIWNSSTFVSAGEDAHDGGIDLGARPKGGRRYSAKDRHLGEGLDNNGQRAVVGCGRDCGEPGCDLPLHGDHEPLQVEVAEEAVNDHGGGNNIWQIGDEFGPCELVLLAEDGKAFEHERVKGVFVFEDVGKYDFDVGKNGGQVTAQFVETGIDFDSKDKAGHACEFARQSTSATADFED